MKAVLLSDQPQSIEKIVNREKEIIAKKSKPNIEVPFKVYLYCPHGERLNDLAHCGSEPIEESVKNGQRKRYQFLDFGKSHKVTASSVRFLNNKVVGEFICDRVYQYSDCDIGGVDISRELMTQLTCMTRQELRDYEYSAVPKENCAYKEGLYGWHISNLVIYDEPKQLSEFNVKDKQSVKECKHRDSAMQSEFRMIFGKDCCSKNKYDTVYCNKCKIKPLTKAPSAWQYVEELK